MFVFKEDTFQRNPSNPCPDNEFNCDVIDFIKEIRKFYPELEHWSNTGVPGQDHEHLTRTLT